MLRRSINKKISSILVLVNLRKTACANDYFYLFYLLSYHLLASSVCSVNVSVLHLENDDKANTFHFPNDELQKTHDIPKVRAQDLSSQQRDFSVLPLVKQMLAQISVYSDTICALDRFSVYIN